MDYFIHILLLLISKANSKYYSDSFSSNDQIPYRNKLLFLDTYLVSLLREKFVSFNYLDSSPSITYKNWEYHPDVFSSNVISKGTYALIASVRYKNSNTVGILKFNNDLSYSLLKPYNISLTQHTCGFSQFTNDSSYILSYINPSLNGIISVYNYQTNTISIKKTLTGIFTDIEYKVFQCHFMSKISFIVCVAYSESDTYSLFDFNISFKLITQKDFPKYTDCSFCSDTEYSIDFDIVIINNNNFIVTKSYTYTSIDVYKIDSQTITLIKTENYKSLVSQAFQYISYYVLNDDYVIISAESEGFPNLYYLHLPDMKIFTGSSIYHYKYNYGYDIVVNSNTFFLSGVKTLSTSASPPFSYGTIFMNLNFHSAMTST